MMKADLERESIHRRRVRTAPRKRARKAKQLATQLTTQRMARKRAGLLPMDSLPLLARLINASSTTNN